MDSINVSELVERLGSDEDAVRKMAVFKLQSNIGDPSFADVFILEGGLPKLRYLALNATGNTLAYSLTSLSRLLEVDKGWDLVSQDLIERLVRLVATHPLVNILRGAMSILVYIVSRPHSIVNQVSQRESFGFCALKPAVAVHPQFLEMLVSRLSAADHALCANALQLINSLMRDAITTESESDWPKLVKRLQDLGVIEAVYGLMQGSALQDISQPLLEFQALSKVLLRKWRDVPVDLDKPDHRRALKCIHAASNPPEKPSTPVENGDDGSKKKHNPEKWRRLGFETETPAWEFEDVGYLGMMDLTDYVRRHEDNFQRLLLEQSTKPPAQRCPIARASLAVTAILLEHFDVEKADVDDAKFHVAFESKTCLDKMIKPLLLQWSLLHAAGLQAFFRLWQAAGAELEDFVKIFHLVRILLEAVVGGATRTKGVQEIQTELADYKLQGLRQLQMELLELTYEDAWGQHLRQIKDELSHEALQFVKEQRIRCLLAGAWFPKSVGSKTDAGPATKEDLLHLDQTSHRYAKLSHNRRYLHWADFDIREEEDPTLEMLPEKIDLAHVTSVTSNVTAGSTSSSAASTTTLKASPPSTKITISGHIPSRPNTPKTSHSHTRADSTNTSTATAAKSFHHSTTTTTHSHHHHHHHHHPRNEKTLLTLHPQTHSLASEWLDGLLMLLHQQPITNETSKLVNVVRDYGLKIRLLNVRFDDMGSAGEPEMPEREGVDEEFWYEEFGS